jgi:hypothetical protein
MLQQSCPSFVDIFVIDRIRPTARELCDNVGTKTQQSNFTPQQNSCRRTHLPLNVSHHRQHVIS